MGSDAAVYLFDYHRYQDEIIPALHRLLLDGTIPSWIEAVLERLPWGVRALRNTFLPLSGSMQLTWFTTVIILRETLPFLVPDTR